MKKYDVIIIGCGLAGIFTALEMLKKGSKKKILMIEKGQSVEHRSCPKAKLGKCVHCDPCSITTGFSGAGAFSDGKLSLSSSVGGALPELLGYETIDELIKYADSIYLSFGADKHIEGERETDEIRKIRLRSIEAGLRLVNCPIRHLGTEKAHDIYLAIEKHLIENGVEIRFGYECNDVILDGKKCIGVRAHKYHSETEEEIYAHDIVIAAGRRGADWLEKICSKYDIAHAPGPVDIGVRVEVRNEVMEPLNKNLYEAKLIGYCGPFKDRVRTFCQNPGGFVAQENYDGNLAVVNGHSFKEKKSPNTNVSILCSHNFKEPFNQPILYAQKIGELTNMLGNGHIMVQRFGDILDGKRTWQYELNRSNITPTLPDAIAGDITAAMPYRTMTDIIEFIKAVDHIVPGFASSETLLYSPEIKFYSNRIKMDEHLTTNIENLYCLGDSSGWTRGLMMSSVMGVVLGRRLAAE